MVAGKERQATQENNPVLMFPSVRVIKFPAIRAIPLYLPWIDKAF
jgi:hypothetical protein